MMNYHAKFNIGEYIFNSNNTAVVGVFSITDKTLTECDFSKYNDKFYINKSIIVESRLGGGVGFPSAQGAKIIMKKSNGNDIRKFIDSLTQENIVIFSDGDIYATVMMDLILQVSRELNKNVTCFGIRPLKFEAPWRGKQFSLIWQIIEEGANKTVLNDFEYLFETPEYKKCTYSEIKKLIIDSALKNVYDRFYKL